MFLCEDLHSADDVTALARRIDDAFRNPFVLSGGGLDVTEIAISASVGVAFAGPGGDVSGELVVMADEAMYEAKRRGGGHHVVDVHAAARSRNGREFQRDLLGALEYDELEMVYQPIVRTSDDAVVGVEALLRWNHPVRGWVPPLEAVRAAEQTGLILQMGAWALERGCRDRRRWMLDLPHRPLELAVNVSACQLMSADFATTVGSVLARTGMDHAALVLEITETVIIEDTVRATAALTELRDIGVRVAMDDFGSGFSALSYLRQLPIDIVKIDRQFIADIDQVPRGGAIVAAVTNLSHVLGLRVTAEGVETLSQRDEVSAIGCDLAQG